MKTYHSFLIRCWLMRGPAQAAHTVFDVEHIQTGERQRVASFAEVESLLRAALLASPPPPAMDGEPTDAGEC